MRAMLLSQVTPRTGCSVRCLFGSSSKEIVHKARKLIGFSKCEMYEVVADVSSYDKFLPFCTKSTVLVREPKRMIANLEIGFHPIIENYDSTVRLDRPNYVQAICSNGRIFNNLESTWTFHAGLESNPKSCIIDFSVRFDFKSVLYTQVASIFFSKLVRQMEDAFMNEAARRFGQPSLKTHILHRIEP